MLDRFANWVALSKIRDSFISKATTAFSLAAFGLANFASPLASLGVDIWRLKLIFLGSILFLVGYAAISLFIPPEFRNETDPDMVVDRMLRIQSQDFFISRRDITRSIVERYKRDQYRNIIEGPLRYALKQLKMAEEDSDEGWENKAAGLYYSDLLLRQFDRPIARYAILALLVSGMALLSIPTVAGVYKAFYGLKAVPSTSTRQVTAEDLLSALRQVQSDPENKLKQNYPELKNSPR